MHGHRSVVFLAQPCHLLEFIDARIDSRLIHKSQRKTASTFLQGILHDVEHLPAFIIGKWSVLITRDACPCRTMSGKNGNIAWRVSVYGRKEFRKEIRKEVIEQYVTCRKGRKMTQDELARRTGISRPNISRFESGNYNPSLEMMVRMASALDMTLDVKLAKSEEA